MRRRLSGRGYAARAQLRPASLFQRVAFSTLLVIVACGCTTQRSTENAYSKQRHQHATAHIIFWRGIDLAKASLWIADGNGRNQRLLVRSATAGYISPDGRLVAYESGDGVAFVIGSDGLGKRRLRRGLGLLDWTPDGRRLLALRRGALVTMAVSDGHVTTLDEDATDRRTRYTQWGFSPAGESLVYTRKSRARRKSCFDGGDLYLVRLDGLGRRKLLRDGRSSHPIWGSGGIAFRRDPPGCTAGGIWRVDPDGSHLRPLLVRPPKRFARFGYYGAVPYGWLDRRRLVIGLRNEWGDDAALLQRGRIRRLGMQIDAISRNGRALLGTQGGAEFPYTIAIGSVAPGQQRIIARGRVCCPDWNR